jgi:thiamine biosynthesis lipoprotein
MFGTMVRIEVFAPAGSQAQDGSSSRDTNAAEVAISSAFDAMAAVERVTNNYSPKSEVSRLNASAETMSAANPAEAANPAARSLPALRPIAALSLEMARETHGAFDPTIWPVTKIWGFNTKPRLPSGAGLRDALRLVDYRRLRLGTDDATIVLPVRGMGLDLGGISKGYAVDRAVEALRRAGIRHALITTGSTTAVFGGKPDGSKWKIGIENPRAPGKIIGVISLKDGAVSTSGDYQNYFVQRGVRYHHVLDPKTGMPARGAMSVTAILAADPPADPPPADDSTGSSDTTGSSDIAARSDALSTALFVMGSESASRYATAEMPRGGIVVIMPDRSVRTAGNLRGSVSRLLKRI